MGALADISWPSTRNARRVIEHIPVDDEMHVGAQILPMNTTDYMDGEIRMAERAVITGYTQPHELGADPCYVKPNGVRLLATGGAYHKETALITERDMIKHAQLATEFLQARGAELFADRVNQLNRRCNTLVEKLRWDALALGSVTIDPTVSGSKGVEIDIDYRLPAAFNPVVDWADPTQSTPALDLFETIKPTAGQGALRWEAYMNWCTAEAMAASEGALNKLDRIRNMNTTGALALDELDQDALLALFPRLVTRLERIVVYDGGYQPDGASDVYAEDVVKTRFIPDGHVVLIPVEIKEAVQPSGVGDWASTPAVVDGELQAGKFLIVDDSHVRTKNPRVEITGGVYGAPNIWRNYWIRRLITTI